MNALTLGDIACVVGGRLVGGKADALATGLSTDSRSLQSGDLFVALNGQRRGIDFVPAAFARGAAAALVDGACESPGALIQTVDAGHALVKLGAHLRSRLTCPVVALTGSNGKTTTKDALRVLLETTRRVTAASSSFNNRIGVPLTLASADLATQVLVLECGTNAPGEIAELSKMASPTHAVITSIGPAHLEGLGGYSGVLREKLSLTHGLREHGVVFLNGDDEYLATAEPHLPSGGRCVRYGFSPHCDVIGHDPSVDDSGVSLRLSASGPRIRAALRGRHNLANLLAACVVARELGLSEEQIALAAPGIRPPKMRLESRRVRGLDVTFDCYNANPASMNAALDEWLGRRVSGRRVAILGDMRELGSESANFHRLLGRRLAGLPIDQIVLVGSAVADVEAALQEHLGRGPRVFRFHDVVSSRTAILDLLRSGDDVLLKASRGIGLERLFENEEGG